MLSLERCKMAKKVKAPLVSPSYHKHGQLNIPEKTYRVADRIKLRHELNNSHHLVEKYPHVAESSPQ